VVSVSSTGNVVNGSSATCPSGTTGDPGDPEADPPSRRTSTPPAGRRATRTRRPVPAGRTSSPTTRTTGRGSTWRGREAPASSTCPTSTGAARPASRTPART
jgi:hypothetical protein